MQMVTINDIEKGVKFFKNDLEITKDIFISSSMEEKLFTDFIKYKIKYNSIIYKLKDYHIYGLLKEFYFESYFESNSFLQILIKFVGKDNVFSQIKTIPSYNCYIYCLNFLHERVLLDEQNFKINILVKTENSNNFYDTKVKIFKKEDDIITIYLGKIIVSFKENRKQYLIKINKKRELLNRFIGFEDICRMFNIKIPIFWKMNYIEIMKKFEDLKEYNKLFERRLLKNIVVFI
jgi:hypothetical protein